MADEEGDGKLNLSQLRNLVRQYIDIHLYDSAVFWADKVCTLSNDNSQDVLWLAHCLFLTNQQLRAAHLLKSKGLTATNQLARYLAAKCYAEYREWKMALEVLDGEDQEPKIGVRDSQTVPSTDDINNLSVINSSSASIISNSIQLLSVSNKSRKLDAAISLLKGMVYEALDNRQIAAQCFKDALQHDVFCYEAFNLLISHHSLTSAEELQLIESLPFANQCCSEKEIKLLKFAYSNKVNKYSLPSENPLPAYLKPMSENLDYIVSLAEKYFNNSSYREAYEYAKYVLKKDNLHEGCLPLFISCLSALNMINDLYDLAHQLVTAYPTKSVSWYAIGSYYLSINKNDSARKYFSKATTIDSSYGPALLGFAHSFASDGERDQAISAYFSASQHMPGSHLPFLYLGREYALSHDIKLAIKFYKEAMSIASHDPHIKLELGTLAYDTGEYEKSEELLLECLNEANILDSDQRTNLDIWEPLYNNLGHVSRKLGKYEQSLCYHEQAQNLSPKRPGTYSALGLCHMMLCNYEKAVCFLHKALSLKRDDPLSMQLLNEALKSLSGHISRSDDIGNETSQLPNASDHFDNSYDEILRFSGKLNDTKTSKKSMNDTTMEIESSSCLTDRSHMSLEMSDIR